MASPPSSILTSTMYADEGTTSICDEQGNLLFYSNGETVYNKYDVPMANGSNLAGSSSSSQSSIIVKKPGSSSLYYLFTVSDMISPFYYSLIDMSLSSGSGSVTAKNVLLSDSCYERMTAVRHCNGIDTWVVVYIEDQMMGDQFRAFRVGVNGVNPVPVKSYMNSFPLNYGPQGYIKISPNGKKLGFTTVFGAWPHYGSAGIFDFDTSTGIVSNFLSLGANDNSYSCEFSPDGTKFYTFADSSILQWDLCAGSDSLIFASKMVVGSYNCNWFTSLQLGPDSRIYVTSGFQQNLAVINNPNQLGMSCNFSLNGPSVAPKTSHNGLPNFVTSYFKQLPPMFGHAVSASHCNQISFSSPPYSTVTPSCTAMSSPYTNALWDFGDPGSGTSNTTSVTNPSHIFSSTGQYTVRLILNTNCGADTLKKTIVVGCANLAHTIDFQRITLFPNPGDGLFYVELQLENGTIDLVLFDVFGKLIKPVDLIKEVNTLKIDLSDLACGVYFLQIKQGELISNRKLIITK